VDRGITFVGHVIKPTAAPPSPPPWPRPSHRVHQVPDADVHQIANSYFGLLGQARHSHHHRAQLAAAVLQRGHCINAALTKTYPKGQRHA
jgi:RNA-directed DNA polymerase